MNVNVTINTADCDHNHILRVRKYSYRSAGRKGE